MRRKYLGLAIAAITALGPASAFGGDREIAQEIMTRLKSNRDAGTLKDFTLDMKVDQGVVLFRGSVSETEQKQLVLAAAKGIEGIEKVVDEVSVRTAQPAAKVIKPKAKAVVAEPESNASLREMLATQEPLAAEPAMIGAQETVPGEIQPAAAVELATSPAISDQQVVAGVVSALGKAQQAGELRGFGVDVTCNQGVVTLTGRAGSQVARDQIVGIAQTVPGVQSVDEAISVIGQPVQAPAPVSVPAQLASSRMAPVSVDEVPTMAAPQPLQTQAPVAQVAAPMMAQPVAAAHPQAMSAPVMGAPVQGTPVAMNYGGGMGAPRYDAPNLPNYAWPGYAAYPNYAALTYPQQYSPTAWPYIGPFYPYPQVPLGWRKVSLEWDDGWWFLDFTDR